MKWWTLGLAVVGMVGACEAPAVKQGADAATVADADAGLQAADAVADIGPEAGTGCATGKKMWCCAGDVRGVPSCKARVLTCGTAQPQLCEDGADCAAKCPGFDVTGGGDADIGSGPADSVATGD